MRTLRVAEPSSMYRNTSTHRPVIERAGAMSSRLRSVSCYSVRICSVSPAGLRR
ncbi:hypothetical protein [Streptomyces sp. LN785]|uniref:hypothetical protein n=1 Tax=Streptomyces sp. LN785 TaxID=3112983 RepID=UPI003712E3E3